MITKSFIMQNVVMVILSIYILSLTCINATAFQYCQCNMQYMPHLPALWMLFRTSLMPLCVQYANIVHDPLQATLMLGILKFVVR